MRSQQWACPSPGRDCRSSKGIQAPRPAVGKTADKSETRATHLLPLRPALGVVVLVPALQR